MRRILSSTVARLVIAIFALQILSGAAAIGLLRLQMLQVVEADRTRQVLDVRDDLLATYYNGGRAALERAVAQPGGSLADPLIFVSISGGKGLEVLSHVARLPDVASSNGPVEAHVWHEEQADPVDAMALTTVLDDGTRLVVGAVTTPDRRFDTAFAEAITLTVVLTLGLALTGALLIGFYISRRTHAIAATTEALGRGNFAARIASEDTGDGFDHLRRQINAMAERIDRLVAQLQSVSAALAHDLRSPVARLRASIETALDSVPDEDAKTALQLALSDAEALDTMLSNALELSRLESGMIADRRVLMDLATVAEDLVELYEPLAEQRGITLEGAFTSAMARIDRELAARALSNLIDNALKYGCSRIVVGSGRDGENAVLWVADDGPGIAEQERGQAMQRHIRLDNARTRPGAGLGLAMASAVAHLHGGQLELLSADAGDGGGLLARIVVPAC